MYHFNQSLWYHIIDMTLNFYCIYCSAAAGVAAAQRMLSLEIYVFALL